jgi:alkylation response protein AidB-like acyl-CoA dehydrogenase
LALARTALDIFGPQAELAHGEPGEWLDYYVFALAGPIYAGSNEIQRNIIAERMLGLPKG